MNPIGRLKNALRDGPLNRWLLRQKGLKTIAAWERAGRPPPPPPALKQKVIRDLARQYDTRVLVETGTYFGNTIASALGSFDTLYSIELSAELYHKATRRFARFRKVKLRQGDSPVELPHILAELDEPALFWLDAHYSGDGTAHAAVDTPILQELQLISCHRVRPHAILIDDARCFNGTNDYPTIDACRMFTTPLWPSHQFQVLDDIIRITPR